MSAVVKKDKRAEVWNGSQAILDANYLMMPHGVAGFLRRLSKENILSADYGLVLMIILEHKYDRENPYPSQDLLAKKAGISVDAVGQAIAHLTACGLIRKEKKAEGKGISYDIQPFIDKFEGFLAQYTKENDYKVDVRALFTVEELAAIAVLKDKKRKHKGKSKSENAPVIDINEVRKKALDKAREELQELAEKRRVQLDQEKFAPAPPEDLESKEPESKEPEWKDPEEIPDELYTGMEEKTVRILKRNQVTDPKKIDIVRECESEFIGLISKERFWDKLESSLTKYKYDFRRYFLKSLENAIDEETAEFEAMFESGREMTDEEYQEFIREAQRKIEEGREKVARLSKDRGDTYAPRATTSL